MKIGKGENVLTLDDPLDASSNPLLAVYSDGDPERNPGSYAIVLMRVPREEIFSMPTQAQERKGRPERYSVLFNGGKTKLALWPIPDRDYHAFFEFNPPRRRI